MCVQNIKKVYWSHTLLYTNFEDSVCTTVWFALVEEPIAHGSNG